MAPTPGTQLGPYEIVAPLTLKAATHLGPYEMVASLGVRAPEKGRQAEFMEAKDAEFHPGSRVPRHCIRI